MMSREGPEAKADAKKRGARIAVNQKAFGAVGRLAPAYISMDVVVPLGSLPRLDRPRLLSLADSCAGRAADTRFGLTLDLIDLFLARAARAGLMGELQGPDLMQSWVLLHQKGWDIERLNQAIASI